MTGFVAIEPAPGPIEASVRPPGSKSQTIRALVAAGLARGTSRLLGPLEADDTRFASTAMETLGAEVSVEAEAWVVEGTGGRLRAPEGPIDAGASGLTARALIALGALVDGPITVVGRERLPERPMGGLVEALGRLGVDAVSEQGHLPVTVRGTGVLPGGDVVVESSQTSQFASALLLAAPLAAGPLGVEPTGLIGSLGYLEVTLATMRAFGAKTSREGARHRVEPTGYVAAAIAIEPDASAAVYPMVAAAITGGKVTIEGLGSTSLQPDMEIVRVLRDMGCVVSGTEEKTTVEGRAGPLAPVDVDLSGCPDGALAIAVACLFAYAPSRLRGLGSLRFKESDRLAATANELARLGAVARVEGDGLIIEPGRLRSGRIDTYGDHRIAMSFGVAGLRVPGIEISDPGVVTKTWPGYWEMLSTLAVKRPDSTVA
jgi:3-phosphoshikimate 1-carboxyvinyltransferase